jgi:hypothetical protein
MEKRAAAPRVPRTSTIHRFVHGTDPLVTSLDAATLPVARGAYGAKVEQPGEKRGSKQCRSLTELIFGLNFRLIKWNGMYVFRALFLLLRGLMMEAEIPALLLIARAAFLQSSLANLAIPATKPR